MISSIEIKYYYQIVFKTFLGTFDPNYQTLAGVGGEVFGQDKKAAGGGGGGGGLQTPMNKEEKAGTFDPNYQVYNILEFLNCLIL